MNLFQYKVVRSFMALSVAVTAVGCSGETNFLRSVNLAVTEENQVSYIDLSAQLDLGNVSLAGMSIPVQDPRTGIHVGTVELLTLPTGKTQINLRVDANVALNADPSLGATLPNGRAIPSAVGAAPGELLAFPILDHSRVYIGGDLRSRVIAGVALAVKGLDGLMSQVGASSTLFFSKSIGEVKGVAGLYGSSNANQSGIAVFANYSIPQNQIASSRLTKVSSENASQSSPVISSAEQQSSQGMSDRGKERVYRYFYGKKRVLRPH